MQALEQICRVSCISSACLPKLMAGPSDPLGSPAKESETARHRVEPLLLAAMTDSGYLAARRDETKVVWSRRNDIRG